MRNPGRVREHETVEGTIRYRDRERLRSTISKAVLTVWHSVAIDRTGLNDYESGAGIATPVAEGHLLHPFTERREGEFGTNKEVEGLPGIFPGIFAESPFIPPHEGGPGASASSAARG